MNSKIEEINQHFKVPMYYNDHKVEVHKTIITDLELIHTVDPSCNPIYHFYFNNDNDVSLQLNKQLVQYYTTDVQFLTDNQTLLKSYTPLNDSYVDYSPNYKKIVDIWNELKIDVGFKERYYFIEWEMMEFLNRSQWFLQFMSVYNLLSPIFSLLVPIIILIIPFFIIKMKGLTINVSEYIQILKTVASTNAIGKLFTVQFSEITSQERVYIIVSAIFYLFSIYQNFMVCYRFNQNMKTIHSHFKELNIYLTHTIRAMEHYYTYASPLLTHSEFNAKLNDKLDVLKNMHKKIECIGEYSLFNVSKLSEIGYVFACFYELHSDLIYDEAILFSLGFHGYIDCIRGLQSNLSKRQVSFARYIDNSKKTVFKHCYYAPLKDKRPIRNTVKLKQNMIITGPNASGKTTILKSTLINILLTQQFGCGFYSDARIKPFHHIHCYLNIPDTSGRDSLFQAEARRCKDIIDSVQANPNDTHFCAFDELYSGTNPEEAEKSAVAFMKYLTKFDNVSCILTTHFIKVCKQLAKLRNIGNYRMKTTTKGENRLEYAYLLEKGISTVKGGIMVLQDMNYPTEIILDTATTVAATATSTHRAT